MNIGTGNIPVILLALFVTVLEVSAQVSFKGQTSAIQQRTERCVLSEQHMFNDALKDNCYFRDITGQRFAVWAP